MEELSLASLAAAAESTLVIRSGARKLKQLLEDAYKPVLAVQLDDGGLEVEAEPGQPVVP